MSSIPVARGEVAPTSGLISHTGQNTAHISKGLNDAGHWIVSMNLVFEIDKALIVGLDKGFKDFPKGHDASADRNLTILIMKIGEVFYMHVEQARADLVNGLNNVGSGTHGVADVNAAAHARVHVLDCLKHIERRREHLVLGAVVVNGDAYVVLLYEFLHTRKRCRGRDAGDNERNACTLGVL